MLPAGPHSPVALMPPSPPDPAPSPQGSGGGGVPWAPPAWAPPRDALTYAKDAVTALFLLLALPYVVLKLLTDPGRLLVGAAKKHATS